MSAIYRHKQSGAIRSAGDILNLHPRVSFPPEADWADALLAEFGYERTTLEPVETIVERRWLQPLEFRSHIIDIAGEAAWVSAMAAPELRTANETLTLSRLGVDPADAAGYLVAATALGHITSEQATAIMDRWPTTTRHVLSVIEPVPPPVIVSEPFIPPPPPLTNPLQQIEE